MSIRNGFTLIELLVAMTAGALLLVSLGWAVSTLGREAREDPRTGEVRDLIAASGLVTRMIEAGEDTQDRPFVVTGNRLEIMTAPPQALGPIGLVRFSLGVERTRTGDALVARLAARDGSLPAVAGKPVALLSRYREIRFEALPSLPDAGTPGGVRIRLRGSDGRQDEIVAFRRMNSQGGCIFDPIAMACRS